MKTYINLGLAFRDSHGTLIVSLQLIPVGKRAAIATADFKEGAMTRFLHAASAAKFRLLAPQLAQPTTVKSLEWAFPTSETAESNGFGREGCWTIQLGLHGNPLQVVRAFPSDQKDYALSICRDLPFAWSPICAKVNPEYVAQPVTA